MNNKFLMLKITDGTALYINNKLVKQGYSITAEQFVEILQQLGYDIDFEFKWLTLGGQDWVNKEKFPEELKNLPEEFYNY